MAVASTLRASAVAAPAPAQPLRWILAGLVAMPAATIAAALDGALHLEVGVAVAAMILVGWPGMASALIGIAAIDLIELPDARLAAVWIVTTVAAALACGVPQRGTTASEMLDRPIGQLLWSAVGGAAGAATAWVLGVPVDAALTVGAAMWCGALLMTPLLCSLFEGRADRYFARTTLLLIVSTAIAIGIDATPALGTGALAPGLAVILAGSITALISADRGWLTAALTLALACGVLAAALPGVTPSYATLGTVTLLPLLLSIGLAERRVTRLQAAQAASRSLFDAMMRFIPVGIVRVGLDGQIRYANPMFYTLSGLTATPADWLNPVHEDDRAQVRDAWDRFQRGTSAFNETFRVIALANLRWVLVRISAEYDAGRIVGYIGTAADVTRQRRSEDARHRSEAQSRAILDTAVDAIVTIDEAGIVLSFNTAAQTMFGYRPEEVIGKNVKVLMPDAQRDVHDSYLATYLRTGERHIIGIGRDLDARRKDGSLLPIHLSVSEVSIDGRRTFTGIMRDISVEQTAKEEIRRQNEQLSLTLRNAPTGIATYRFGQTFASTNRAFEQMLGYRGNELQRLDLITLTHPEDRRALQRLTDAARAGHIERFQLQLRLWRRDAVPTHVIVHAAIAHDAQGKPDLVIAQVEDLTAELHAQEVEQQQQARLTHVARLSTLGEMTAGIAHEINQPLTAITMYARSGVRMLQAGVPQPERLREALEKLTAQSLRAGAVIDRIQRLVRRQDTTIESVDLNDLIRDIMRLAETDARVNDIQIELDLADDLPTVNVDPIQIQQVLLNLIRNGIDAMHGIDCANGRSITLSTRQPDAGTVSVAVRDAGTGVGEDFAAQLFTPFATTKVNGMGMGLSICRSIIEAHGGKLSYVNNADCGATFYFNLPTGSTHDEQ
jgi:two-component system, LuxR family, sensor kinase FixL